MKTLFDEVKRGLADTGKQMVKRTRELTDTVQIRAKMAAERENLARLYALVGRQVFEAGNEEWESRFEDEFAQIRKSLKTREELEAELQELEGAGFCPQCGAKTAKNALFCSRCGAKLAPQKREEEKEDEVWEEGELTAPAIEAKADETPDGTPKACEADEEPEEKQDPEA